MNRLLIDESETALEGVGAFLVYSTVDLEMDIWDRVDPEEYYNEVGRRTGKVLESVNDSLSLAEIGNLEACLERARKVDHSYLGIFLSHDNALSHVNAELRKLYGTIFNAVYTDCRIGSVVYVSIGIEVVGDRA